MLTVSHLSKAYRKRKVLDNVSFTMSQGERVALMGPSGSGKSTLLNCISGLDAPDEGSIQLNGQDIVQFSPDDKTLLRRKTIGSIFQFFHLLPSMTAVENVCLPLQLNGFPKKDQLALAESMLKKVGVYNRAQAFPREMSGGEMQRVAIARALVVEPTLLLADEPTGNLDAENGDRVLDLLEQLSEQHKVALLLVTHQPETTRICHRNLHMTDGKLSPEIEPAQDPSS